MAIVCHKLLDRATALNCRSARGSSAYRRCNFLIGFILTEPTYRAYSDSGIESRWSGRVRKSRRLVTRRLFGIVARVDAGCFPWETRRVAFLPLRVGDRVV
jgi:hypothetical protein